MLAEVFEMGSSTPVATYVVDEHSFQDLPGRVVVLTNEHAPHQFALKFVLCKTRVRATCEGCDWVGFARKPNDQSTINLALDDYQAHLPVEE